MRIVVVGATRNFFKVGHATFKVLARTRPDIKLRLVIPDVQDARRAVGDIPVEFHTWDPQRPNSLYPALDGCSSMLMVPPIDNRVRVAQTYIKAAQSAGVGYVLCLGVQHSRTDATMGSEAAEVSDLLSESGLAHRVLHLPMFLENLLYQVLSIADRNEFQFPVSAESRFSYITCGDLADVFARVLANPMLISTRDTFWTASSTLSCAEWATALSEAVGVQVRFRTIEDASFVNSLQSKGMSQHAARAVLELWQLINQGKDPKPTGTFSDILGRPSTSAFEWTASHSCCFRSRTWASCGHPKPPRDHMY